MEAVITERQRHLPRNAQKTHLGSLQIKRNPSSSRPFYIEDLDGKVHGSARSREQALTLLDLCQGRM